MVCEMHMHLDSQSLLELSLKSSGDFDQINKNYP